MMIDRYLKHMGASVRLVNPAERVPSPEEPHATERRQITGEHIAGALLSLLLPEDAVSYSQDRLLSEWCKGAAAGVVAAGEARWKTG